MTRTAAQSFCLAFFAIIAGNYGICSASHSGIIHTNSDACALEPRARVSDACASYLELDTLNDRIYPYVRNLANNTDFFSYYRLNLYNQECPFWSDENGLCGNIACAVTTLENEADIPAIWRADELSKLKGPKAQHPGRKEQKERQRPLLGELGESVGESCVVEYDDECDERDYCVPEDESAGGKGDYVSLAENPERFTGYSGDGANQVWEAIYRENCFSRPSTAAEQQINKLGLADTGSLFGISQNQAQAASDFKHVMRMHDRQQAIQSGFLEPSALDFEDECLEKRVFYRVISGLHASISTHLCYDYLNQTTGHWGPNLQCYLDRLHHHPERLSNLYFNYAFVLRAVGKLREYVQGFTFCTGDPKEDARTKNMITILADAIPAGPRIFDESIMFQDQTESGLILKEDFRNRFRNVSRIMDCVGCDKCRLWGKLQTVGFGTALKVLFEFGNGHEGVDQPQLRRTELVALINTLDKISSAIKAIEHFREMVAGDVLATSAPAQEVRGSHFDDRTSISLSPTSASLQGPTTPTSMIDDLDALDDFPSYRDEHESGATDSSDVDDILLDDAHFDKPEPPREYYTLKEQFMFELDQFWRACKFVVASWIRIPVVFPRIIYAELDRFFSFWLGRPVPPRTWALKLPTLDELYS